MVIYFSGTGNSKYIADRIAGSLQEKLLCMNEQIKSGDTGTVKTGENLVVVVPTLAIKHGEHLPERKYGLGGRMESGLVNSVFYPVFVKAKAFHTDQTCTGCGKCVKVCPLNNVTMKDKKPVWGSHCTHCMACICHCPAEAIEYGRKSVGKPRYCFENLGIEEKGTLLKDQ